MGLRLSRRLRRPGFDDRLIGPTHLEESGPGCRSQSLLAMICGHRSHGLVIADCSSKPSASGAVVPPGEA